MGKSDNIFQEKREEEVDFSFNQEVTKVFEDMLERSVPQYKAVHKLIMELIRKFSDENTNVYDLGCSKGFLCQQLIMHMKDKDINIIGVDNSEPMIESAKSIMEQQFPEETRVTYRYDDITREGLIENASAVILCLVLQFIRPTHRLELLRNIYSGMNEGGILLVYEKTIDEDPQINRLKIDLYHDFKKSNGYSDLEISQKRIALENVLVPYSNTENIKMLKDAGFSKVVNFYQWLNFCGYLAIK